MLSLIGAIIATLIVNLPFGYWRSSVKKFSPKWFLAVHLPIPFVIGFRFLFSLGFQLYTYPFLVGAFFTGQWIGGWWFRQHTKRHHQLN
jgi:hypothetical protein